MWVIRIVHDAAGLPCPEAGMYLKAMDFEAMEGFGHLVATPHIRHAMQFRSPALALQFYHTVPMCHPKRADGKPNKPLTAYTICIENV
jgi:hypothetical protein